MLHVEIVWGSFARLDIPTARVIDDAGKTHASCRHQHRTAEAAYACGLSQKRKVQERLAVEGEGI